MEFQEALQRIFEALKVGEETTTEDWTIIFSNLVGNSDAETIINVQNFIKENFSFEIEAGAEGYAYFGNAGATTASSDIQVYKYVDAIVESSPNKYGYISSTQAGKLFNDKSFNDVLKEYLVDNSLKDILYNGKNSTGEIFEGVQSFNDFLSENYVMSLKESNVNTMLSGDYSLNCFGRTEFQAIMENDAIKTINGIDKNIYMDIN